MKHAFLFLALVACGGGNQGRATAPATHELPPADPVAVAKMVQGVQAAKDGQRDRAAHLLREAISIDTNLWEARYDLGLILTNMGDLAGAEDQLSAAAKLAPDSQEVASARGEVLRRRGSHKAAAEALGDFVERHPDATDVRTLYVAALRNSGQIDKAIAHAREVLVRKPGDAQALAELALCHLARGERETATLLARQALDANRNSATALRAMGLIHLQEGDDAQAFASFAEAARADPRDTTARMNMGTVLLRAGAYAKAEPEFRAILQATPEDSEAQIGLAAALRGQADPKAGGAKLEEARAILTRVLERDPHNVGALFNLGVLYTDFLKKPDEARPLFKRFLSDAPGDHPSRADAERYLAAAPTPKAPVPPPPSAGKK
jgi:Flp pilus assembly protein TadD